MSFAPIAIVGRSCVLPGALSPQALWQLVRSSRDEISAVPEGRWRAPAVDLLCLPDADSADKSWSDRGGYIRGFDDVWDASGFALPASELEGLDPLFLWSLHCARQALNEAGDERLGAVDRPRVGAVFGNLGFPSAGMTEFAESQWLGDGASLNPRNRFGSSGAAALLEQALGLAAGVTCLDTACASSLYAIKMACDQLHDGEHDLVLAGAVNRADDLFIHVGFTALNAMSRSGQSRPFNADADGLVPAEGAGFLALKRLGDARRDGNTIFGIIRGIGLSNDGRSGGFLAPAEEGQQRALAQAYKGSGLSPADVGMLECHATGTSVGDAAEIRSSAALFEGLSEVPIGSLKSNMGHLITAAGVAGLIKILEAMHHQERPPSLHSEPLNPVLENTPFRVLAEVESWPSDKPRVAALSAFGFGGNNAHLLVSEDDPSLNAPELQPVQRQTLAIIAAGAVVGPCSDRPELLRSLSAKESLVGSHGAQTGDFDLALGGLRFPPRDLQAALGQQVVLLKAAREAMAQQPDYEAQRCAVYLGMEPDVEVCRFGLRWRLAEALRRRGLDPADHEAWLAQASDLIVPTLEAAGVVGNMPNIPANRLNSQFDFGAGSWSVSSGRSSGSSAFGLAQRALSAGEVDVAMVAAVDLSCQSVHLEALAQIENRKQAPGDAAVVLLLKRASDAEAAGDEILALLDPELDANAKAAVKYDDLLGDSFAAGGLRDLLASALLMAAKAEQSGKAQSRSLELPRPMTLRSHARPGSMLSSESNRRAGPSKRFSAHPQSISLIFPETELNSMHSQGQTMKPAPELAPIQASLGKKQSAPFPEALVAEPLRVAHVAPAPVATAHPSVVAFSHQLQAMTLAENEHIAQQTALHNQFLSIQSQALGLILADRSAVNLGGANLRSPSPPLSTPPLALVTKASSAAVAPPPAAPAAAVESPKPSAKPAPVPTGPSFTRAQLETHASGNISEIYGERFKPQDSFRRQVRMPEAPLLLADRVTGLDAELGSMGLGTIWSETDVQKDAWYMHQGHMPAGIMIESGQADLMLISYLGVDFTNRNDRVYRLLGCELTYTKGLPQAGDTLSYDIHMDGHATQGDVRLMFFHYDCRIDGEIRLRVRQGQAGFFTDQELAESDGCLWSAEDEPPAEDLRLDAPQQLCTKTEFSLSDVRAFSEGRIVECFGPGYERALPHTRTPRIQEGPMMLLGPISGFDPRGGPWKRGYAKSTLKIDPKAWFFDGHFKNDSCMPGTLMLEGCLQLIAFTMTGMGYTLARDGWRFEPVPETPFPLSCRGQVTPESGELIYEIFIQEVHDGPVPKVYADLLCTVDGLKSFYAKRLALQLSPAWPLDEGNPLTDAYNEPKPVFKSAGFDYGYHSLMACAQGRPSQAFGPMYERFDGPGRVARLPNPPYHFLSRVCEASAEPAMMNEGTETLVEYDIPTDAWYFDENGCPVMPFAVLLEAALQPCGWLASYLGCALTTDTELCFRNLDGVGTVHAELPPNAGSLSTRVVCTGISSVASMIIVNFDVRASLGETLVYDLKTVFGFFPQSALENQKGLTTSDEQRALMEAPANYPRDLKKLSESTGRPALAKPMLLMIDRIELFEPQGGSAGLGLARAVKDVDQDEWFFKAHFFQDPVQPGSLGIEAMLQLLQWMMLELNLDAHLEQPRFEGIALGEEMTWKYRGQVVPSNKLISSTLEITEIIRDDQSVLARATASLWVDGKRIYEAENLGMRLVSNQA